MSTAGPVCAVAIPARDEAALIGRLLTSLARQTVDPSSIAVVVIPNNCTDDTADMARSSRWPMQMTVIEAQFGAAEAHAGSARRLAVDHAASRSDIVLTTDADCVADDDWVASMIAAFADGADAVAGRVSGDWDELRHHSPAALNIGALEWDYLGLLGEAEAAFDPRPHDPAPRHAQRCGANIGITRQMLAKVGGVPGLPTGEDRALLHAVEQIDGKLRHDPRPHVTASARVAGRATGGMADALAHRLSVDYMCDEQFERAEPLVARLRARHTARQRWMDQSGGSRGHFGQTWSAYLATQPDMQPRRITPVQLAGELAILRRLLAEAHDA